MFADPGVLLVWSGDRPCLQAARIPGDGLTLGRDLLERLIGRVDDDRISRQHTQLLPGSKSVGIRDLVSRNGTYVNAHPLYNSAEMPYLAAPYTVVRTGRSVWLVVPDLARYEGVKLARRGRLVVGGSLAEACRRVDAAAADRAHLAVVGAITVGRELARGYATTIGGKAARFDLAARLALAQVLGHARPRTLVIELTAPFPASELPRLEDALASELRVVTLVNEARWFAALPGAIQQQLATRRVELPAKRYDELSTTVFDLIRDVTPAAKIHATVIERCLIGSREIDEDSLMVQLRESLLRWRVRPTETLRGEHLRLADPDAAVPVMMAMPLPMPDELTKLPTEPPTDASWHNRRLCADGDCFGVISTDGACRVCGRVEPLGDPYR